MTTETAEQIKTMTEGGNSQGVCFFVAITKHGGKKYKAVSTIIFSTHNEVSDWNEPGMIDLVELSYGRAVTCKGNHFFYENPYSRVVDATIGLIAARIEQIGVRAAFGMAAGGESQEEAARAVAANGYDWCVQQIQILNSEIQKASDMARMKPETNPSDEHLTQMAEQVERLINIFSIPGIVALTGNSSSTVNQWVKRGRISAQAAHEMCKIKEIKSHGFTRELMRPDVGFWYIDVK